MNNNVVLKQQNTLTSFNHPFTANKTTQVRNFRVATFNDRQKQRTLLKDKESQDDTSAQAINRCFTVATSQVYITYQKDKERTVRSPSA